MLGDGYHDVPAGKLAMVVTYLEMHAPAPTRPVTLAEGVTFRKVTPTLDWYRDVFTRVGGQDWLWYGRLKMTDVDLSAILNNPDVHIYTLQKDGRDEALLELDFRQSGECELAYFGLTPALIGSGAGRYLMNEAIARAWGADITRFHVHTCTLDSPQAVDFYVRSGFAAYKRSIEIDDDPRVTGILPRTAAAAVPVI
ncbi:GNAT family N-acetyltransferase [Sulfitobacter sp. HNIBRBA2951]|uniref:GNAT family N-acetyltransferase n=1 Tax=Sulfitobacter aquimarinus TaxID=3158557 RepID=UPI0032DFD93E